MAKSLDTLMETETTLRWDETGAPAELFTASPAVRKVWQSYGFPIRESTVGQPKRVVGWFSTVPVDRIAYKPFKKDKA